MRTSLLTRISPRLLLLLAPAVLAGCGGHSTRQSVDWPVWGGTAQNTHYSSVTQVNVANVLRLRVAWTRSEGPGQTDWETFPIVVGSTMYYTTDTDEVVAVDAGTGHQRWSYVPDVDFLAAPQTQSVSPVSRGVAVGGGRVYDLTYDDQLIALNAGTGRRLWDVRVANAALGYAETSPGTYWNGEVIIGGPAGDAGLRGFVAAYGAATGRQLWRTYVVPATRNGGDVWMPPVVDPATGRVYAATGNPEPAFFGKRGCDPSADATVALSARTGRIEWTHTEVCGDAWDYDTTQSPELFDVDHNGREVAAVGDASKVGFYSILAASSGALLARTPELVRYSVPHRLPSPSGAVVCPGIYGGLEYGPAAYSTATHELYLTAIDMCMRYRLQTISQVEGEPDLGGTAVAVGPSTGALIAIDPATGHVIWERPLSKPAVGGALATAGGLVFAGDDNGELYAVNASTGATVWRADLGLRVGSAPIAYQVDGREFIAIAAGGSEVTGDRGAPGGGRLFVFSLGGVTAARGASRRG